MPSRPRRSHSMREFKTSAPPNSLARVPPAGRRCQLVLLDERRLDITIQTRLLTSELLDMVASHCNLKEKKHFGIAHQTEAGQNQWLHPDVRVLEHDLPKIGSPLILHFLVRYYPESFTYLREPVAVELLYQQTKSLVFKGELEADGDVVFRLAALALQAAHGDYTDDATTRQLLKRTALLPASVVKLHPSLGMCEERVIEEYTGLVGTSRGNAIVAYLSIAERLPTYGVHFYKVTDKLRADWWLGISTRGIAQCELADRTKPGRLFQWKQLENVTFRDKRFSIEVDEPKKVVHALSSFNVYEDAIGNDTSGDDLITAISDPCTQVSVSRRTLGPGHISVYSWFAASQTACRNIWFTAVSQHQFHVEGKKESRVGLLPARPLSDIAADLSRSSVALSLTSSTSSLSHSGSLQSLTISSSGGVGSEDSEQQAARMEMSAALQARRQALEAKLAERTAELRMLCMKEAELTGQLPPETPLEPGEQPPQVRRRMGTAFTLPEALINRLKSSEEEMVAALEMEYEIQSKITTAALKLANDATLKKAIRKQRKLSYQMSAQKLREIELKLKAAKAKQQQKRQKKPRPSSDGEDHHSDEEDEEGSMGSAEGVSLSPLNSALPPRPPRSPLRQPLDISVDSTIRTRAQSAPASPKKLPKSRSATLHVPTSRESSPSRHDVDGGYIPSSVYTRSSYRSKQYPTLSRARDRDHSPGSAADLNRLNDAPPPPPPREYWSPAGLYSVSHQRSAPAPAPAQPAPMHHLSVDELDGSFDATPQPLEGGNRFGSLDRRRHFSSAGHPSLESRSMDRLEPPRWPPPPQPPRFTDSPLSGASEALRACHARTGSLPAEPVKQPSVQQLSCSAAEEAAARKRRDRQWYETSLDSPDAARRARDRSAGSESSSGQSGGAGRAAQRESRQNPPSVLDLSPTPLVAPPRPTQQVPVTPLEALAVPRQGSRHGAGAAVARAPSPSPQPSPRPSLSSQESPPAAPLKSPLASVPAESPKNQTLIQPGTFQPYRETSKPFEMSDFYKYSTKYRRKSQGTPQGGGSPHSPLSPGLSAQLVAQAASQHCQLHQAAVRQALTQQTGAVTQRGLYQPPTPQPCLPARHTSTITLRTSHRAAPPAGSVSPSQPGSHNSSFHLPADSVADAFQSEMLAWYENGRPDPAAPETTAQARSATLV